MDLLFHMLSCKDIFIVFSELARRLIQTSHIWTVQFILGNSFLLSLSHIYMRERVKKKRYIYICVCVLDTPVNSSEPVHPQQSSRTQM